MKTIYDAQQWSLWKKGLDGLVIRGGCWLADGLVGVRAAVRYYVYSPGHAEYDLGFRIIRKP